MNLEKVSSRRNCVDYFEVTAISYIISGITACKATCYCTRDLVSSFIRGIAAEAPWNIDRHSHLCDSSKIMECFNMPWSRRKKAAKTDQNSLIIFKGLQRAEQANLSLTTGSQRRVLSEKKKKIMKWTINPPSWRTGDRHGGFSNRRVAGSWSLIWPPGPSSRAPAGGASACSIFLLERKRRQYKKGIIKEGGKWNRGISCMVHVEP